MITETYRTLYRIMNDNMQAASKKALPFDEKMGETVLSQQGEAVDVSPLAALEIERYMQAAYCLLFCRPTDRESMDAAKLAVQRRPEAVAKKRILRGMLCSQAFAECGFGVRGLPRRDAGSIFLWRIVYGIYFPIEERFPSIRGLKDAVKRCVRY